MSSWQHMIKGFSGYLKIERSLSKHTIESYTRDVNKLRVFIQQHYNEKPADRVTDEELFEFIRDLSKTGTKKTSLNRTISGIKAFYKFMVLENYIKQSPAERIETSSVPRGFPNALSHKEVMKIIDSIDLTQKNATRNRAMIETLYSCGLRVTELVTLRISNLHFNEGYITITGKGNKQRLVPVGSEAMKWINFYLEERQNLKVNEGSRDIVFLNNRGNGLTRVMIFLIIKKAAESAGIKKSISPHTLRHSFATELLKNGADLRAIQDMLGHESITTTEIYFELNNTHLKESLIKYHPRFEG